MRTFSYFLFENFDAEKEAKNPKNPRHLFSSETDRILTWVLEQGERATECEARLNFGREAVDERIEAGFLSRTGQVLKIDVPFFLSEDLPAIRSALGSSAAEIVDLLETSLPEIIHICERINNGFPVSCNLYHILCGMILDGSFFDFLSEQKSVTTSKINPSGLDYLMILYEKSKVLQTYSEKLLCSYNRFSNGQAALQSFGDADGDRHDFYRFFRMLEEGTLPTAWESDRKLLETSLPDKDRILSETVDFVKNGKASSTVKALLERFDYVKDGRISVPVYLPEHQSLITRIGEIVERSIGAFLMERLLEISSTSSFRAVELGVDCGEIANELYHLLFGEVNEILVRRGIVETPPARAGEGRYLKSIEIYESC